MAKKEKLHKKKQEEHIDDNRVIASMDIDGVPSSVFRRPRRRAARDEFGQTKQEKPPIDLNRKEKLSAILGIVMSYLLFGLVIFGAFALFILFCVKVWFK